MWCWRIVAERFFNTGSEVLNRAECQRGDGSFVVKRGADYVAKFCITCRVFQEAIRYAREECRGCSKR